jgi:hypothetical protein
LISNRKSQSREQQREHEGIQEIQQSSENTPGLFHGPPPSIAASIVHFPPSRF